MSATADPWWHRTRPDEVLARAKALSPEAQLALYAEVKAACVSMAMRWQDKALPADDRRRACTALRWTVQKKKLLAALAATASNKTEDYDHRRARVERMLEAAEAQPDPGEAVRLLAATLRTMWGME